MNSSIRKAAGISTENNFVFTSRRSDQLSSGYHDFKHICQDANVILKSSQLRHFLSTLKAKQHINSGEDKLYYDHMGHSRDINKHVYQAPRAKASLKSVGKFLHSTDMN